MPQSEPASLWEALSVAGQRGDRWYWSANGNANLAALSRGIGFGTRLDELHGRSVLPATKEQLLTAQAPILPTIIAITETDTAVGERAIPSGRRFVSHLPKIAPPAAQRASAEHTDWVLLTSGTIAVPKLVSNIDGLKVPPDEIGAGINRHPSVRMPLVKSRRSPITGTTVVANVVVKSSAGSRPRR